MAQHVGSTQEHGGGVGDVPAHGLGKRVPRPLSKTNHRDTHSELTDAILPFIHSFLYS